MPVYFYCHREPQNPNELRALYSLARLLDERYGQPSGAHWALVANLCPDSEPEWQRWGLPQVDAILVGERLMALIDFKNYPDQFDGRNIHQPWKIRGSDQTVTGGGSNKNPYQQAWNAHDRWSAFLDNQDGEGCWQHANNWRHLNGFVLFYPWLHPDSRLPPAGLNHLWLTFCGLAEVEKYLFANRPNLCFLPVEIREMATTVLRATPWRTLEQAVRQELGWLTVTDADGGRTQVSLRPFETVTIGRSSRHPLRIDNRLKRVSADHAMIHTQEKAVRLTPWNGRNGTFVNGQPADETRLLRDGDIITLGGLEGGGIGRIDFRLHNSLRPDTTDTTTTTTST